ncbi:fasciclin domain-containing protein [Aequorivita sp. CIP111184]|uniref:fasciclin domain-containing protein n=1 Tax=Aequorivita sp. CIP111184 TaxID=2211356 RepID=UPI000DBC423E|nr:fasciclin domain-containing protein [Aequorivita sp. CIP111184]SRX54076.1 hypothetical protein AEQU1_01103 [Aequorivita sp. CIP111184]
MQKLSTFLLISTFTFLIVSCKNEAKTEKMENANVEVAEKAVVKRAEKRDLTAADIEEINSVMSRVMTTPELKKYASYIVTAKLADMLSTGKGSYTVFAPSNAAIESLTVKQKKFYATPENIAKLEEMVKSHIVEGTMDKENLLKAIDKNGKVKLKTLGGITLTASRAGDNISISDAKGGKVSIVKEDILGSNGVVFVVDGVMNAN